MACFMRCIIGNLDLFDQEELKIFIEISRWVRLFSNTLNAGVMRKVVLFMLLPLVTAKSYTLDLNNEFSHSVVNNNLMIKDFMGCCSSSKGNWSPDRIHHYI